MIKTYLGVFLPLEVGDRKEADTGEEGLHFEGSTGEGMLPAS
jgi:hypothetical protein